MTVREIDKLKEIYELSERFSTLKDPDASITYAREIKALAKRMRPPEVEDIIVKKINNGIITSSKQIRELRDILNHSEAREIFLKDGTSMDDAKAVLPVEPKGPNFGVAISKDLDEFMRGISSIPWPSLLEIKGDKLVIEKIKKCKELLDNIEHTIS